MHNKPPPMKGKIKNDWERTALFSFTRHPTKSRCRGMHTCTTCYRTSRPLADEMSAFSKRAQAALFMLVCIEEAPNGLLRLVKEKDGI